MTTTAPRFDLARLPEHEKFVSEPSDIAYVSGSRMAGLGNARSDLDLFVVYENPARARGAPRMFILEEFRVDMERHALEAMHALSVRINGVDLGDLLAVVALTHDDIDLYYRTALGAPVHNAAGFEVLRAGFDVARGAEVYRAWAVLRAASLLAEARALLDSARPERGYGRARRALSLAVDAFAASHGDGYPSSKWCFVKLARRFGHDAPEFRRPWSLKARGARGVAAYVAEVEAYCADVGVPMLASPGIEAARLAPDVHTRLFEVGARPFLVQRKTRVFALNPVGLRTWRLLDGRRTVGAVIDALVGDEFPNREAVAYHVQRFVTTLRDDGLLVGDLYPVVLSAAPEEVRR